MRRETAIALTLAFAANLKDKQRAYEILGDTEGRNVIDSFIASYNNRPQEALNISPFEFFAQYIVQVVKSSGSDVYYATSERINPMVVAQDFLFKTRNENLLQVIDSPSTRSLLQRQIMSRNGRSWSTAASLSTMRLEKIMTLFLTYCAEKNVLQRYEYYDSLEAFMSSVVQFFLKAKHRDVNNIINQPDYTNEKFDHLHEVDTGERALSSDIAISDLLTNIYRFNEKAYFHSGHSVGAHGIQYDIVHVILGFMFEDKVRSLNAITKERLGMKDSDPDVFVYADPTDLSDNDSTSATDRNRGIRAQIWNSKQIIRAIYDGIKRGEISIGNLSSVRESVYRLGTKYREGRNCLWDISSQSNLASGGMESAEGIANFAVFDLIVKGVESSIALIQSLQEAGYDLVKTYENISGVFTSDKLVRHIDYMSALKHVDLIKRLQAQCMREYESQKGSDDLSPLRDFDSLLDEVTGGSNDYHGDVKSNRDFTSVYGVFDNPLIRANSKGRDLYTRVKKIREQLLASPRSYAAYTLRSHGRKGPECTRSDNLFGLQPLDNIPAWPDAHRCRLGINGILRSNKREAASLLTDSQSKSDLSGETFRPTTVYSAGLEYALYLYYACDQYGQSSGKLVAGIQYVGDPIWGEFHSVDVSVGDKQLNEHYRGNVMFTPKSFPCQAVPVLLGRNMEPDATREHCESGIGYSEYIGLTLGASHKTSFAQELRNVDGPDTLDASITTYYEWITEVSRIQHSTLDILRAIRAHCMALLHYRTAGRLAEMYLYRKSDNPDRQDQLMQSYARSFLEGISRGGVPYNSLSHFIEQEVIVSWRDKKLVWPHIGVNALTHSLEMQTRPVDTYVLDLITAKSAPDDISEISPLAVFRDHFAEFETPTEKFGALYAIAEAASVLLLRVRDAYELICPGTGNIPIHALACEMDARFSLRMLLREPYTDCSHCLAWYRKNNSRASGADDCRSVLTPVLSDVSERFKGTFSEMIKLFDSYVRESVDSLCSSSMSSAISKSLGLEEKIKNVGRTCNLAGSVSSYVIERCKGFSRDECGYYTSGLRRLECRIGDVIYLLHSSGVVVKASGSSVGVMSLNTTNDKLIKDIVDKIVRGSRL